MSIACPLWERGEGCPQAWRTLTCDNYTTQLTELRLYDLNLRTSSGSCAQCISWLPQAFELTAV
jgi:hypothetical protein